MRPRLEWMKPALLAIFVAFYGTLFLAGTTGTIEKSPLPFHDFQIYVDAVSSTLIGDTPYGKGPIGEAFLYPPVSLLVIYPFAKVWHLFAAIVKSFIVSASLFSVLLTVYVVAVKSSMRVSPALFLSLVFVSYLPLFDSIRSGQINFIILLCILAFLFFEWSWSRLSGYALSLAALIKVTPVAFLFYSIITENRRARFAFGEGVIFLVLLSILLLGGGVWIAYLRELVNMSNQLPLDNSSWSFAAMLNRLLAISPGKLVILQRGFSVLILLLVFRIALITKRTRDDAALFIALNIAAVIASPIQWYHHYILLLPGIALLFGSTFPERTLWALILLILIQFEGVPEVFKLSGGLFTHTALLLVLVGLSVGGLGTLPIQQKRK